MWLLSNFWQCYSFSNHIIDDISNVSFSSTIHYTNNSTRDHCDYCQILNKVHISSNYTLSHAIIIQFIKTPFIYNLIKKFRTIRITIEKYRNIISKPNRKASLFERTINAIKKIQPTPRFNSQTFNIKTQSYHTVTINAYIHVFNRVTHL